MGIFLALFVLAVGCYNGNEPACIAEFGSQPGAVEYRDGIGIWGKTCSAIDARGRVISVQHFRAREDWIAAAVLLVLPFTLRAGWRQVRR